MNDSPIKVSVPVEVVPIILNKFSLVGMQLPEKYKEKFDVSSEGPSSGVS
jgi:hypothetical protein